MTTSAAPAINSPASRQPSPAPDRMRIVSIDVFRGFVMFLMLAEVMQLWTLHQAFPDSTLLGDRGLQHDARAVAGLLAARPDSAGLLVPGRRVAAVLDREPARGAARRFGQMLGHAVWRSVVLMLLGIFLRSMERPTTYWTFEDTLTQIGLGYTFLFLLAFTSCRTQVIAFVVILVGFWAAFVLYPLPGPDFDYPQVGVPANWPHLYYGLPRALQQELEPVVGLRRLVPEPVPARVAVPLQRGRLVDAQLHPDAGDDDARHVVGRVAEVVARRRRRS